MASKKKYRPQEKMSMRKNKMREREIERERQIDRQTDRER